jgi:hypothetical protein
VKTNKLKDTAVIVGTIVLTLAVVWTVMLGCYYLLFDLASAIGGNP